MAAHVTAPAAAHKAGGCLGVASWEFLPLGWSADSLLLSERLDKLPWFETLSSKRVEEVV